jgi:hypothetical protein
MGRFPVQGGIADIQNPETGILGPHCSVLPCGMMISYIAMSWRIM